jgi:polyisoprenyl-phosphate glycosyltransferase
MEGEDLVVSFISIISPTFNEEGNVEELCRRVKAVFSALPQHDYEHIFIDNDSTDRTVGILKELASRDRRIKIIVNARNFGHIRSPHHALLQTKGEAVIAMVSDLQDPPELIADFIRKWEEGFRIVIGVKAGSEESRLLYSARTLFYRLIQRLSEVTLVRNFTGFGLYDRKVVEALRTMNDPYPYLRGLICEIGFPRAEIPYVQPKRKRGWTKNNFFTLYDMAMLGITNHSKLPLRLAAFAGFVCAYLSLVTAVGYFMYKLLYWDSFQVGLAPLVIGLFFFSSVQLIFLGILGEYIGSIHTQVLNRPLVVEKERVNFQSDEPQRSS